MTWDPYGKGLTKSEFELLCILVHIYIYVNVDMYRQIVVNR